MIFWGVPAMSVETILNKDVREAFKKSVGYDSLVMTPPDEKLVNMDWKKALSKVTDANGKTWLGTVEEPALTNTGVGLIDARLESPDGIALVKITSLNGSWKQRLDYVMWIESLTNMGEITSIKKPGVDDLFLIPKDSAHMSSCSFLYGNFYVGISHWEQQDISALAQTLWEILRKHSQPMTYTIDQASTSIKVSKSIINLGDNFTVELKANDASKNDHWLFELVENQLPDSIEFVEREGNVFNFNANQKGSFNLDFKAMNSVTFIIHDETVAIQVK
jgi:hypothetical protein